MSSTSRENQCSQGPTSASDIGMIMVVGFAGNVLVGEDLNRRIDAILLIEIIK